MVAVGAESALFDFFLEEEVLSLSSGAKACSRTADTSDSVHWTDMLSRNRVGSSMMYTSDSWRRPSCRALFTSSFLRMWPRPSASPVYVAVLC